MSDEDYKEGEKAADVYYRSQGMASLTRYVRAEDAIRLFLPPIAESLLQTSTPLPKPRKDWIAGFKNRQKEIMLELGLSHAD